MATPQVETIRSTYPKDGFLKKVRKLADQHKVTAMPISINRMTWRTHV